MKKLLLLSTLLLTVACAANIESPTIDTSYKNYAEIIQQELQAEDWAYTYQKVEPSEKNAYIIDFYDFEPYITIYTKWYCTTQEGDYNCERLLTQHL